MTQREKLFTHSLVTCMQFHSNVIAYEYPVVSLAVYNDVIYSSLGTGNVSAYGRKDFVFVRRYEGINFSNLKLTCSLQLLYFMQHNR